MNDLDDLIPNEPFTPSPEMMKPESVPSTPDTEIIMEQQDPDGTQLPTFINDPPMHSVLDLIGIEPVIHNKISPKKFTQVLQPEKLYKTKACRFVTKRVDGSYTKCLNEDCKFAHSISELRATECRFGENCNNSRCSFLHPEETVIDLYQRLGNALPDLPTRCLIRSMAMLNLNGE